MNRVRVFAPFFMALMLIVSPAQAGDIDQAKTFIDGIGKNALQVISEKTNSQSEKKAALENLFSKSVDIDWVGRFVLGRYWRKADEAQQARYLKEYKDFLLSHYAGRFADYSGGSYSITGAKDDGEGKYVVSMAIDMPDNPNKVMVDYRVREEGGAMKIYDVIVEGVSLITTQRSEFASVVSSKGIDYLIDQLASKSLKVKAS